MTELSFQLYSARNFPPLADFLPKLAALGYKQVEGYGGLYGDAGGLAAQLKSNGLAMPTGHFGLDQLKDTATALKTAETIGMKKIYCPYIGVEDRSTDDSKWVELAETLASLGETYTKAGYGFGWHNHDFEFLPTSSGRLPMDIILETAPDIEWEADVAWIVRGKADPIAWFDRYGSRITAVHVKDIAPAGENANEDGWADVGHGRLDWDNLITKVTSKTKAEYFVAEHDNPSDAERFASRSIATAKKWK
ncbi:xylose isomerase [Devosia limi DSM 17137]|uniref:Sugar phosphate isomerase/epimerase n=1 Tax=Devosia limi DSM 17137 TaxID=1121477 RepID=A0A0F5LK12_9HYPH|nr:sugar phosphate isomerase/epimerase [Devosia limi]KKB82756.1 xylose isomerase [Devosia limi DSM 17137]SHF46291.1 Sugar phosphate isomerase/epimerase [Devosia limi DSM 17137]